MVSGNRTQSPCSGVTVSWLALERDRTLSVIGTPFSISPLRIGDRPLFNKLSFI